MPLPPLSYKFTGLRQLGLHGPWYRVAHTAQPSARCDVYYIAGRTRPLSCFCILHLLPAGRGRIISGYYLGYTTPVPHKVELLRSYHTSTVSKERRMSPTLKIAFVAYRCGTGRPAPPTSRRSIFIPRGRGGMRNRRDDFATTRGFKDLGGIGNREGMRLV